MTASSPGRDLSPSSSESLVSHASDPGVVLPDECLEDVMLPPGGLGHHVQFPGNSPCDSGPEYVSASGRDLRIDLIRGYFVLAMVVDHVRGPSPLWLLTGGNRFYTSAAEGFILTSGLVAGLVYHHLIERDGMGRSLRKVLRRAGSLYLLTIGLTLLFLPLSEVLSLPWAQGVDLSNPLGFVVSILTLHRTYYLVDVMLLYTVLFLISPLAFYLLASGKTRWLLAGSWLLWGLFQIFPEYVSLPWPVAGNYLFQFSAWQVLFFTGLALGRHHDRVPTLGQRGTRFMLALTGILTVALIVLFFVMDTPTDAMPTGLAAGSSLTNDARIWLQEKLLAKADLRPGRMVASAVVFAFLFFGATVLWKPLRKFAGWLLLPLGQHALYAYTAHVVIVALVGIALLPLNLGYPGSQWLNGVIQAGSVMLIWLLVRYQVLAPTPRTRRWWHASPAAFAVLALVALSAFPTRAQPAPAAPKEDVNTARARLARAYGTPIPSSSASAVGPAGAPATPVPMPTPERPSASSSIERVSDYVGDIEGSLAEHWFYSQQLDRDMPYYIYLPPDYGTAGRRYPVLYMLHGGGGHREEWVAYNLIDAADQEIHSGSLPPMIIVLPQGDTGWWANHAGNGPQWGDYVLDDLVPHIDGTYRTLRNRSARAIGGLSMGGWGALQLAFNHPDLFGIVGAHSPSFYPEGDDRIAFLGTGDEFANQNPFRLARTLDDLGTLQIWLDVGERDPWLVQTTSLHQILQTRAVQHYWAISPGGHDWQYWRGRVLDYVRFYGHTLSPR